MLIPLCASEWSQKCHKHSHTFFTFLHTWFGKKWFERKSSHLMQNKSHTKKNNFCRRNCNPSKMAISIKRAVLQQKHTVQLALRTSVIQTLRAPTIHPFISLRSRSSPWSDTQRESTAECLHKRSYYANIKRGKKHEGKRQTEQAFVHRENSALNIYLFFPLPYFLALLTCCCIDCCLFPDASAAPCAWRPPPISLYCCRPTLDPSARRRSQFSRTTTTCRPVHNSNPASCRRWKNRKITNFEWTFHFFFNNISSLLFMNCTLDLSRELLTTQEIINVLPYFSSDTCFFSSSSAFLRREWPDAANTKHEKSSAAFVNFPRYSQVTRCSKNLHQTHRHNREQSLEWYPTYLYGLKFPYLSADSIATSVSLSL